MAKIAFDKYYTPPTTARFCIDKVKEIIGTENITEWVEPSAGSGSFSHQLPGCKAYDLFPQHEYIEQANFLETDLGYKPGRCFIGNPPFGSSSGKLLMDFYKKCCKEGDYIAFIQPAAFYNNYNRFNIFEIVYSTVIETEYTNERLKTSFTIYKRNPTKNKWSNEYKEIKSIQSKRTFRTNKGGKMRQAGKYDYAFNYFGSLLKEVKPYESAGVIVLNIDEEWRDRVISFLKWLYWYNKETKCLEQLSISAASLSIKELTPYIRAAFPDIP